jgi:hypothetical protein
MAQDLRENPLSICQKRNSDFINFNIKIHEDIVLICVSPRDQITDEIVARINT